MSAHAGALEAVDRILNRGGEREQVLGAVAEVLLERLEAVEWIELHGQVRGEPGGDAARFDGVSAGPASALTEEDERLLRRVATLVGAVSPPR